MVDTHWQPDRPEQLGALFRRLGRFGFWVQVVLLAITVVLGAWVLMLRLPGAEQPPRMALRNIVALGSVLILAFTTYWFRRYEQTGEHIPDETTRPSHAKVHRMLWTGLWAGGLGVLLSLLLMMGSVGRMLFLMLSNPQVGVMLAPGMGAEQSISAIDALSLMALLLMMGAELVVLSLTLWLMFRSSRQPRTPADALA